MSPPRRSRTRLALRALAATATALLVLVLASLALLLAISRGWQRERVVAELEARLGEALGAPVEVATLEGPLVPGLTARGLRIGGIEVDTLGVRWRIAPLLLEGRLEIEELTLQGVEVRIARDAEGRWQVPPALAGVAAAEEEPGLAWRIERLRVADARLRLEWTVEDAPGFLETRLDGEIRDVALAEDGFPVAGLEGRLGGGLSGEIAGSPVESGHLLLALPGGRALHVEGSARGGFGSGDLEARLGLPERVDASAGLLEQTSWRLSKLSLAGEGVAVEASASGAGGELDGLSLDLSLERLERIAAVLAVDENAAAPALAGTLRAHAELSGPAGRPSGVLDVRGRDLAYGGHALGALDARFRVQEGRTLVVDALALEGGSVPLAAAPGARLRVEDDRVEIEGLHLRSGERSVDVSGALARDGARGLSVSARNIEVDPLAALLGAPLEPGGVADLILHLDGPWSSPRGDAELAWQGPARPGIEAFDAPKLALTLRSDGRRIALSGELGVATRERVATFSGTLPIPDDPTRLEAWLRAPSARASLSADAVALAWLDPWLPEGLATPEGRARLELQLAGATPWPRLSGWIELEGGVVEAKALAAPLAVEGRVHLEGEEMIVDGVRLGPADARATLSGSVRFAGLTPRDVDLDLALDGFRLELANGAPETGPAADFDTGRIDGRIRVTGRLPAPVVQAQIDWRRPRWQSFVLDRITLDLSREGSRVVGDAKVEYAGEEIARVEASLPIPAEPTRPGDWLADQRAMLRIHGEDLELAMLAPWLPRALSEPHGLAHFDVQVRGAEPVPRLAGRIELEGGSLKVRSLRRVFDDIAATASFDNSRVRVESLSVGAPGARAEVRGTVALAALRPTALDLVLSLDHFPLSRSSLVRTDVDGELTLAGTAEAPDLRGRLALVDASFRVRGANDPAVKEIRILTSEANGGASEGLVESAPAAPDLFDHASVDVSLTVPRETWVRGPGLDLNLSGAARVEKLSDEPPGYSGEFEALRGTFELYGRRFEIRKGRLALDGGSEIDPVIDLEAVHRVARVDVIAYVTGRLSAPELRLESAPPMPEPDIVSYLIFGRPADQLAASEQSGVNGAATALAAGVALGELRETFGDLIPIDTADVHYNEDDSTTYVEVGKYIARDIFVRFGYTFGPEPVEEVGVSWRLNDHWSVESSTSSNASAGGDVFWRIDY